MRIIEQIKKDQLAARIMRDQLRASLLTTLIGEADTLAKNKGVDLLPDADTIALIQKFVKNADIVIAHASNDEAKLVATTERDMLQAYLPKMLTDDELYDVVCYMKRLENCLLKDVMSHLKEKYAGRYDGKKASQFYKEI